MYYQKKAISKELYEFCIRRKNSGRSSDCEMEKGRL